MQEKTIMKKCLLLLPLTMLISCGETKTYQSESSTNPVSVWDYASHSEMMNMPSDIKTVEVIQTEDDGFQYDPSTYTFDLNGNIKTYRKNFNIRMMPEKDLIDRYLKDGFTESAGYEYYYDAANRPEKIMIDENGESFEYNFVYGTHDKYVPVILPVGDLPLYLTKGLTEISGSDDFRFTFDGETGSYTRFHSWLGREIKVTYEYGTSSYPQTKKAVVTQRGDVVFEAQTEYKFNKSGYLLSTSTVINGMNENSYYGNSNYSSLKLLCLESEANNANTKKYNRDSDGRLIEIVMLAGSINTNVKEEISYSDFNSKKDWTKAEMLLNNEVNENHYSDKVTETRSLKYWNFVEGGNE